MSELFKSIAVCKIKITDYMNNEEEISVHVDESVDRDGLREYKADDFKRYIEHQLGILQDEHRKRKGLKHVSRPRTELIRINNLIEAIDNLEGISLDYSVIKGSIIPLRECLVELKAEMKDGKK